ncbi:hypothetical protein ACFPAF_01075 [Hymenobacter endophyticus]|uniref:DUF3108 domain-containing protein n=1 Tax=Hymenobacter endophyticus TaxID=3076335 RepID=A0ABU3TCF9_9BACT|nr:hypothetical protein [Hymenobacter endophyticus]MDU0368970.1 hypothetical protein [Hymenobacter endophyticus]
MNPLWEDGQEEVAVYEAEQKVDGEIRRFVYTQATAKEEFNQQYNVRTDSLERKDIFPVMRLTQLYSMPGTAYPHHAQATLFFRRDQPVVLHKLTASVQEWAGNVFKAILDDGLQYQQAYTSYHDGQGSGQRVLRHNVLFEDALPYTLRSLDFARRPSFPAAVYELQLTNQASRPTLYQAQVRVEEGAPTDTPDPAWRVRVTLTDARQNQYWFAKAYPNVLLRRTTWDGRTLWLKQVSRRAAQLSSTPAAPDSVTTPSASATVVKG